MKAAHLYIRVSTDEQADKGYSQRNQDEVLRKYCQLNAIQVREVIYEDHSAKTFNRPAWQAMLSKLKKDKNNPNLILFTKWDRFSRNTADAYGMISLLRQYHIEPQAIEQPLDLSVPENKMMLAFYLAVPEVENDRRALNVFHGMRRARKEGRWISAAPMGYTNKSFEDGRKYIAVKEPQASILKWAFTEISKGKFNVQQIWLEARKKGLMVSKNNFWTLVRNPIYCGKIVIPQYKDEAAYMVDGLHEPLIPEELFFKVQRVLDGRKRIRKQIVTPSQLPLRGFLKCPLCSRMLSGSASRGRANYHHYYHCSGGCKYRVRADAVNTQFSALLGDYVFVHGVSGLAKAVVKEVYSALTASQQHQRRMALQQLEQTEARLKRARDLLLSGDLESDDYKEIKTNCEERITALKESLSLYPEAGAAIEKILHQFFAAKFNLAQLYGRADTKQKRRLVQLLFPANIKFAESASIILKPNVLLAKLFKVV